MLFTLPEIQNILDDNNPLLNERLRKKAEGLTNHHFGRAVSVYAPIYLSNYCQSLCSYCGFNRAHSFRRFKLTEDEMRQEMRCLSEKGIKNILLLTGESPDETPLDYLVSAVEIAKAYFSSIALEIYPQDSDAYRALYTAGADGLTVYQETYDRARYKELHAGGQKADFDFRRDTARRAGAAGFRSISLGVLLGLSRPAPDLLALFEHLREMEKTFPAVEYSLSFPRLRPIKGALPLMNTVDDETFLKMIALTRVFFPHVGINLSTRERAALRDRAIFYGVTRISAESRTSVGGYSLAAQGSCDPQFDVQDDRTVDEIKQMLRAQKRDAVLTDWRRITNT